MSKIEREFPVHTRGMSDELRTLIDELARYCAGYNWRPDGRSHTDPWDATPESLRHHYVTEACLLLTHAKPELLRWLLARHALIWPDDIGRIDEETTDFLLALRSAERRQAEEARTE